MGLRPKEGVIIIMQQYEIAVLYHPDLEVDLSKAEDRVTKIFTDNKAKITNTDNWGKKKLAYPINKLEYAIYVFYTVETSPQSVASIESALNITDEVIRFLIVRMDEKELAKAEAAKKAESAKREADNKEEKDEDNQADEAKG